MADENEREVDEGEAVDDGQVVVARELGNGTGAHRLATMLFLVDAEHRDDLAHDLGLVGQILWSALVLSGAEIGDLETVERMLLSKAVRIQCVLADDGPDRYVAKGLKEQEGRRGNKPGLRALVFHAAHSVLVNSYEFAHMVTFDPEFYGSDSTRSDRLLEALSKLQGALETESRANAKKEDEADLRRRFQDVLATTRETVGRVVKLLSYPKSTFEGDPEGLRLLGQALDDLGKAFEDLCKRKDGRL